jgi:hypothetical protein
MPYFTEAVHQAHSVSNAAAHLFRLGLLPETVFSNKHLRGKQHQNRRFSSFSEA